jgi:GMP synthase (glutamine-hydrolysing)
LGFVKALAPWTIGKEYEFVRYDSIAARRRQMMNCRGLILSGSLFDFALPNDAFDRDIYRIMIPVFQLMRDLPRPVLGICFGHQLMALGEEFAPDRIDFGRLRIRNMPHPPDKHLVGLARMNSPLRFSDRREFWVQFNHKQEVVLTEGLQEYFEILSGSDQCPVHVMQHRSRDWFGVQFHPEIGKQSLAGEVHQHDAAERDGSILLQEFVQYCLK